MLLQSEELDKLDREFPGWKKENVKCIKRSATRYCRSLLGGDIELPPWKKLKGETLDRTLAFLKDRGGYHNVESVWARTFHMRGSILVFQERCGTATWTFGEDWR